MVNQYKVFSAVMNNFDQAVKATEASLNSQGATAKQNAIYMESLEAKTQALKAQFEKLVLGDGGLQKIAKLFVDLGTNILKLANSDFGQLIIKVGLTVGALTAFNNLIKGSKISGLITEIASLKNITDLLSLSFIKNAKTWLMTPMGKITIAVGAIVAIIEVFNRLNVTIEEHNQKLIELSQNYKEAQSNVEDTQNKLEDIRKKISDINSGKLEITDDSQLQKLKEQESVLASQLAIQERKLEIAQKEIDLESQKTLGKKVVFAEESKEGAMGGTETTAIKGTTTDALNYYVQKINESQNAIDNLMSKKDSLIAQYGEESTEVKAINDEIAQEIEKRDNAKDKATEYAETLQNATENASDSVEGIQKAKQALTDYAETMGISIDKAENQKEVTEQQKEELESLAEAWGITKEAIQEYMAENDADEWDAITALIGEQEGKVLELGEAYKDSISSLDDMASSFKTLSTVMNDYNNSGYLSIDNLTTLLSLDSEYLGLLQSENGQLVLNEQAMQAMANAKIDEAEATLYDKAMKELDAIAVEDLKNKESALNVENQNVATTSAYVMQRLNSLNQVLKQGAEAWNNYWYEESKRKYGKLSSSGQAQIKAVTDDLANQLTALESARKGLGNYTKAVVGGNEGVRKNTSATKNNTKARDENKEAIEGQKTALEGYIDSLEKEKEALEKEKDKYETSLEYMVKVLEKYKNQLEDARDAELDSIENQIDALEEEEDRIISIREKELEALESERDSLLDQNKEELEALKSHRDSVKETYDEEINKIKERNSALDEQLELEKKIEAVANAKTKKVKVFRDGQFVYESDASAVSKAQQELSEYQEELKRKNTIKELEKERDAVLAVLDSEIEANKSYSKELEKTYDDRIKEYKDYTQYIKEQYSEQKTLLDYQKQAVKDSYKSQIDDIQSYIDMLNELKTSYKDTQDAIVASETTGLELVKGTIEQKVELIKGYSAETKKYYDQMDREGKEFGINYSQNLGSIGDGLSQFVTNYNNKLAQLEAIKLDIDDAKTKLTDLNNQLNSINSKNISVGVGAIDTSGISNLRGELQGATDDANALAGAIANANLVNQTGSTKSEYNPTTTYRVYQIYEKGFKTKEEALSRIEWLGLEGDAYKSSRGDGTWEIGIIQSVHKSLSEANSAIAYLSSQGKGKYEYGMSSGNYASGVSSIDSNQLAIVGEDPNKEIVIGSKINNGTLMSLSKGSGVVNAKSTNTLAGLLNQLATFGSSNFGGVGGANMLSNSNSETFIIENVTIDGANITDIESFKNSLMSMKMEAIQRAYRR